MPDETIKLKKLKHSSVEEHWSVYKLENGTHLKLRPIVTDVEQHIGQVGPTGDPMYQVKAALIIEVIPKKKSKSTPKAKRKS